MSSLHGVHVKSKTVAERAAWNFIADEGGALARAITYRS
jgi:hypothetical protein